MVRLDWARAEGYMCERCDEVCMDRACGFGSREGDHIVRVCGWCRGDRYDGFISNNEVDGSDEDNAAPTTNYHYAYCYICDPNEDNETIARVEISNHLSLPSKATYRRPATGPPALVRERLSAQKVVEHSNKRGHIVLWEAASREQFVARADFNQNVEGCGPLFLLVQIILKHSPTYERCTANPAATSAGVLALFLILFPEHSADAAAAATTAAPEAAEGPPTNSL
jgi:hypothetical protein